ncbi:MAG TPA: MFS transporter, partial [Aggregatilineales bacterium]|nr:MFS transporter [Aggregatilineales bacterium]
MDASANADKLNFKLVFPIFVIVLIDLLGLTIIIPLLPLYAATFGANPLMIGIIGATFPLLQLIGSPLLGGLSDRFGRKPVLIVSQIGTLIGFLLLGAANALPLLLLSRAIDGLSGANIVAAQASISDITTERNRAQGLGLIGAAFGLGFTIGPALAGIALALTGNNYRVPAYLAAGFSLLSIILTVVWFKETLPAEKRGARKEGGSLLQNVRRAFSLPVVALLLILIFMQQ